MEMEIVKQGEETVVSIKGRVDTVTAPELEKGIAELLAQSGISLVFDCKGMEYISSSGLRVVLSAHKKVVAGGGKFTLEWLDKDVKSVFDLTGFSKILTIR